MIAPSLNCNGFRARWQQPEGLREFSDIHVDAGGTYAMVRFRSSDPICPMVLLGSSPPERQGPKGPEFRSSSVVRAVVMAGKPDPDFEHEVTVLPVSGLMPGTTYHLLIKGVGHRNAVARFSTLGRRIEWWFDAVKATDRHDRPRDGVSLHVRATGNEGGACECRLESGRPLVPEPVRR